MPSHASMRQCACSMSCLTVALSAPADGGATATARRGTVTAAAVKRAAAATTTGKTRGKTMGLAGTGMAGMAGGSDQEWHQELFCVAPQ